MSKAVWAGVVIISVTVAAGLWRAKTPRDNDPRQAILDELKPVALKNCALKRYGGNDDGGYLMCENLIAGVQSAYSYGIDKEDNWGCQISREFQVGIQQYDCFTPHRPVCEGGRYVFHDECVGKSPATVDGERFDSVHGQILKNGDAAKRLIVKMDVEGAEWDSLLAMPDEALNLIDQLPMEFHGIDHPRALEVVRRLKLHFHLVNLHFNNFSCSPEAAPFPAFAFQVLWVSKRLGEVDPAVPVPSPVSALNTPDDPTRADCQLPKG